MGGRMTQLEDALVGSWAERWRYMDLVIALASGDEHPGVTTLAPEITAEAVVKGLSEPSMDLADALGQLIEQGEFAAADSLLDDELLSATLPVGAAGDLRRRLQAARVEGEREAARRVHELRTRARRAGAPEADVRAPGDVAQAWERRQADGEALLEAWAEWVVLAERTRQEEAEERLRPFEADHPRYVEVVRACVEAGEYPVVGRLLDQGPDSDFDAGPLVVDQVTRTWPYPTPPEEALEWYFESVQVPRGFRTRWCPPRDDEAGWALLRALRHLWQDQSEASVATVADSLDLLMDHVQRHRAVAEAGGVRVALHELSDRHVPWLRLPSHLPLWVGPQDWAPPSDEIPAVWLGADGKTIQAPPGVAVVDAAFLLNLVAPDRHGPPLSPSARRINLLREICRQLPLAQVVGNRAEFDPGDEPRDALAWLFDMLGLRAALGVFDAILYDTAGRPAALSAAVEAFAEPVGERGAVTMDDLKRWRQDAERIGVLRERVLAELAGDPEALLLVCMAIYEFGDTPGEVFLPGDLTEGLEEVGNRLPDPRQLPELLPDSAIVAALNRAAAAGWLWYRGPEGERYELQGPGLIALLSGDYLRDRATEILARMATEQAALQDVIEARKDVLTTHSRRHLRRNYVGTLRSLVRSLATADLPDQQRDKVAYQAEVQIDRLAMSLEIEQQDYAALLRARPFAIMEVLDELSRTATRLWKVNVRVAEGAAVGSARPERVRVLGSRMLVDQALENLVINASQAAKRVGIHPVSVGLGVDLVDDERGDRWVVIDVEDSGPGIPDDIRGKIQQGEPCTTRPDGDGGQGLEHVRKIVSYCRGKFDLLPDPSPLGGAHFRVWLPPAAAG
jgi:signal transduction histidine kinase